MSLKAREILKNRRLGDILKSLNLIDDEKLNSILGHQSDSGVKIKLGEVLTKMGYVDKEVILSLVGKQLGHPYIRVTEYGKISDSVLKFIPQSIAKKHMVIPFAIEGDVLKIAMADPQEDDVRAALSVLADMEVEAYITSEEEINEAIKNNYS